MLLPLIEDLYICRRGLIAVNGRRVALRVSDAFKRLAISAGQADLDVGHRAAAGTIHDLKAAVIGLRLAGGISGNVV